ncbi:MAG: PEP-utilizing enzyme [Desulfobacterales bacterium]|nr:PEP-utilizing enzyme [Desulfobacterales bacterium]
MSIILTPHEIKKSDADKAGGKGVALAEMSRRGFPVPRFICITTDAYTRYATETGLRPRIELELNRKDFHDMRWEEIWDASLRIRNMFLRTQIPENLRQEISDAYRSVFKGAAVVVRSSAPAEDTKESSFAGLHESYVNIRGEDAVLEHVKKVWASLWSDAALLYRKELGLDVFKSSMAVIVQEIIDGDRSGVVFTKNPNEPVQGVIESVYGLNQGLVDGAIEPDRWFVDRSSREIVSHVPATRENYIVSGTAGIRVESLPQAKAGYPPLNKMEVHDVFNTALKSETLFNKPQDMEWTYRDDEFFVLQSRPITAISENNDVSENDKRLWYLSLRRSLENLKKLRVKIEGDLIPAMIHSGEKLKQKDLATFTDEMLADEIQDRIKVHRKWVDVYWAEFIPFAHGARLFGKIYNERVRPEDPYEFVELLETSKLQSLERNRRLEEMADSVRANSAVREALESGHYEALDRKFLDQATQYNDQFFQASEILPEGSPEIPIPKDLLYVVLEMAKHPVRRKNRDQNHSNHLQKSFLDCFEGKERKNAEELLDLARASYRLRDDDNMYLGQIEKEMDRAVREGTKRLCKRGRTNLDAVAPGEIAKCLKDPVHVPEVRLPDKSTDHKYTVRARQLIGQPAVKGLAAGPARVIREISEIRQFKSGEVLVCDAIDPNITFAVPLAAAIAERRGGMLIHGAIIAREYGIPCVTGIPDLTGKIETGDFVTVDGFLGIITINRNNKEPL